MDKLTITSDYNKQENPIDIFRRAIKTMSTKLLVTFLLVFSALFTSPQVLNNVNAAVCKDKRPSSAPVLISAVADKDSVKLTWTEAMDPVTYYLVAYSRSETEIEYGNPNVGGRGTTTYTVGRLTKGVKYYFKVSAVNGCRPGKFSNKLSATPGVVKSAPNKPNLSIYRPVQGIATTSSALEENKTPVSKVIINQEPIKCLGCVSWQLLIIEIIVLLLFNYLTRRYTFIKPFYSIIIPILIYVLFRNINQDCMSKVFTCKYFAPLEVIIFISMIILYKNKYLNNQKKVFKKINYVK